MSDQHSILNYAADYHLDYNDRSLIDKQFLEDSISVTVITVVAGTALSSGRLVYLNAGKAYYFDPMDETLAGLSLGITKTAALQNANVDIQTTGIFEENGLGLTPELKYFVGINGTLTTNIAGLKVVQQIGVSIDANKLLLNFYSPYITN